MGGKAEELYHRLQKSNAKLAKQYDKLFKNLDNGASQKVVDNRVKKINQAAAEFGKTAGKATKAKTLEETVEKAGDETQKKLRGVSEEKEEPTQNKEEPKQNKEEPKKSKNEPY
ncbi:MAG: hypothetical protein KA149_01540 [Chitinophagales bacterium]|nr:hypothetical protein [Chitinophagales bacterium]